MASAFRIAEVADLLGVSDDTVRRWVDGGQLPARRSRRGPMTVSGAELAQFVTNQFADQLPAGRSGARQSARNRLTGLVTSVVSDRVMAQVEIQVGRHRMVALISSEAVADLGIEPGVLATASVKATNVVVEVADQVRQ
ncbi:MAG: molybdopterin-binding protein [Actinomycetes bacterium]